MNNLDVFLEKTWDGILSRDIKKVRKTFNDLSLENKKVILDHLNKMVQEPGWHPEQVLSAKAALEAINAIESKE